MKKEYINPEMDVVVFEPTLLQSASPNTLNPSGGNPGNTLAPGYDDDDDEDWGDEEDAVGGRRKVY